MTDVEIKLDGLQNIIKALKAKPPVARIGILSNAARSGGGSNATIGASHEFGTTNIPQRSFLRIPLAEHLEKKMESSGAFSKEVFQQVVNQKTLIPWVKKIAVLSEEIVATGFDTEGYGKWAPLNPKTMARKKVKQILVETQQLRNSITSEVKEGQ